MKRRNLSGIYYLCKLDGEDKRTPTCFEDCSEEKQEEILDSLETEALKNLAKQLANVLKEIGDVYDIKRE